jgi:membrane protease YdiL (CAAX protease family)
VSKRGERRKKKKRPAARRAAPATDAPTTVVDAEEPAPRLSLLDRVSLRMSTSGARAAPRAAPADASVEEAPVELTEDGEPMPRWGMGEAFGGFAVAIVVGGLAAGVILAVTGYEAPLPSPGGAVGRVSGQLATGSAFDVPGTRSLAIDALQQLPFWAALLAVPYLAARFKGNGWVTDFRIRFERSDILLGLGIGIFSQIVLVTGFYWLLFQLIGDQDVSAEARELTDRATTPLGVVLLFLIVGVGAPIAEEVFFRGLALRAFLKKGWSWWPSIIVTSLYFGATHLQPLQFPALVIFGLVVGWLVWRTDRLGPAIWAHVGFNLTAAVVLVWNLG